MNILKNTAHIVYATDDKFAEILGVSLTSLYENSKGMDDIIVYILDSGISDENKTKIIDLSQKYEYSIPLFIKAKNISDELGINVSADRGSLSQYARLFISSHLPDNLQKVIYLDCDTIVEQSISELWNLDMHGKTIAALMDAFSKHYRKNIDLSSMDIMFNSGVMLIDLNRWKEQKVENRLLEFISRKRGRIQQGDQGALNHVLSNDIFCFEPRFNSVTIFYDFTYQEMLIYRKPPEFYPENLVKEAVEKPNIIHFTTSIFSKRPWIEGCQHKFSDKWLEYKAKSPWKDVPLWKDNRSFLKKRLSDCLNVLPRKFSIAFASLFQAYIRPFIKKYI